MAGYLGQLRGLSEGHGTPGNPLPVICAGDIFDRYNAGPELINFALAYLPRMYAIPGQHDLPHHSYEDIRKSAYWTLVEAGKILNLEPGKPVGVGVMQLWGFPWGTPVEPCPETPHLGIDVAVVHQYVWMKEHGYPGAPEENRVKNFLGKIVGYDAVVVGDNHKGFKAHQILNCLLPGNWVRSRPRAVSKSYYSGEAVELRTASGLSVRLTGNHPVFTTKGFVSAGSVSEGQYLLSDMGQVHPKGLQNEDDRPRLVEDVFSSFSERGSDVISCTRPAAPEYFHGDGEFIKGDVDVVMSKRILPLNRQSGDFKNVRNSVFERGGVSTSKVSGSSSSYLSAFRVLLASPSSMARFHPGFSLSIGKRRHLLFSGLRDPSSLFGGHVFNVQLGSLLNGSRRNPSLHDNPSQTVGFAVGSKSPDSHSEYLREKVQTFPGQVSLDEIVPVRQIPSSVSNFDSQGSQKLGYGGAGSSNFDGDGVQRLPRNVTTDKVIGIRKFKFSGHVYDLQTEDGVIIADCSYGSRGLLISNCGGFMRRKSNEREYQPTVGLLRSDGSITRYKLDVSGDKFLDSGEIPQSLRDNNIGMESFIEELSALGDAAISFREAVTRLLDKEKIDGPVRRIVLQSLEQEKMYG